MFEKVLIKKLGVFAGGVIFGTAGLKILSGSDAKKVYANVVAAGLRAKDCVLTTTTKVQENTEDIIAEAKEINRQRKTEENCEEECKCNKDKEKDLEA